MKYILGKLKAFLLILCLVCALYVPVYAHEIPDESRTGTITLTLQYDGQNVKGGTLTAYRVGAIHEDDGNYSFELTDDFMPFEGVLEDVESPELAADLADFAEKQSVQGMETANVNGKVVFDDLELGLYLIVQKEAAPGYSTLSPFLVSVPLWEENTYKYIVDATPKIQPVQEEKPVVPSTPPGSTLPQTGQLNWPVPVMAIAGLIMFSLGWGLYFGRRKYGNET